MWKTLWKTHNENDVNGDETKQVSHDHSVNHYHERSDQFESSSYLIIK